MVTVLTLLLTSALTCYSLPLSYNEEKKIRVEATPLSQHQYVPSSSNVNSFSSPTSSWVPSNAQNSPIYLSSSLNIHPSTTHTLHHLNSVEPTPSLGSPVHTISSHYSSDRYITTTKAQSHPKSRKTRSNYDQFSLNDSESFLITPTPTYTPTPNSRSFESSDAPRRRVTRDYGSLDDFLVWTSGSGDGPSYEWNHPNRDTAWLELQSSAALASNPSTTSSLMSTSVKPTTTIINTIFKTSTVYATTVYETSDITPISVMTEVRPTKTYQELYTSCTEIIESFGKHVGEVAPTVVPSELYPTLDHHSYTSTTLVTITTTQTLINEITRTKFFVANSKTLVPLTRTSVEYPGPSVTVSATAVNSAEIMPTPAPFSTTHSQTDNDVTGSTTTLTTILTSGDRLPSDETTNTPSFNSTNMSSNNDSSLMYSSSSIPSIIASIENSKIENDTTATPTMPSEETNTVTSTSYNDTDTIVTPVGVVTYQTHNTSSNEAKYPSTENPILSQTSPSYDPTTYSTENSGTFVGSSSSNDYLTTFSKLNEVDSSTINEGSSKSTYEYTSTIPSFNYSSTIPPSMTDSSTDVSLNFTGDSTLPSITTDRFNDTSDDATTTDELTNETHNNDSPVGSTTAAKNDSSVTINSTLELYTETSEYDFTTDSNVNFTETQSSTFDSEYIFERSSSTYVTTSDETIETTTSSYNETEVLLTTPTAYTTHGYDTQTENTDEVISVLVTDGDIFNSTSVTNNLSSSESSIHETYTEYPSSSTFLPETSDAISTAASITEPSSEEVFYNSTTNLVSYSTGTSSASTGTSPVDKSTFSSFEPVISTTDIVDTENFNSTISSVDTIPMTTSDEFYSTLQINSTEPRTETNTETESSIFKTTTTDLTTDISVPDLTGKNNSKEVTGTEISTETSTETESPAVLTTTADSNFDISVPASTGKTNSTDATGTENYTETSSGTESPVVLTTTTDSTTDEAVTDSTTDVAVPDSTTGAENSTETSTIDPSCTQVPALKTFSDMSNNPEFWVRTVWKNEGKNLSREEIEEKLTTIYKELYNPVNKTRIKRSVHTKQNKREIQTLTELEEQSKHLDRRKRQSEKNDAVTTVSPDSVREIRVFVRNVTYSEQDKETEVVYTVFDRETPKLARNVVSDMNRFEEVEMKERLGYDIVIKAQEYLYKEQQVILPQKWYRTSGFYVTIGTTSLIILILLIILLVIMYLKWKKRNARKALRVSERVDSSAQENEGNQQYEGNINMAYSEQQVAEAKSPSKGEESMSDTDSESLSPPVPKPRLFRRSHEELTDTSQENVPQETLDRLRDNEEQLYDVPVQRSHGYLAGRGGLRQTGPTLPRMLPPARLPHLHLPPSTSFPPNELGKSLQLPPLNIEGNSAAYNDQVNSPEADGSQENLRSPPSRQGSFRNIKKKFHDILDDAFSILGSSQRIDRVNTLGGDGDDPGTSYGQEKSRGRRPATAAAVATRRSLQVEPSDELGRTSRYKELRQQQSGLLHQQEGSSTRPWSAADSRQGRAQPLSRLLDMEVGRRRVDEAGSPVAAWAISDSRPGSARCITPVNLPQREGEPGVTSPLHQDIGGSESGGTSEEWGLKPGDPAIPLIRDIREEIRKLRGNVRVGTHRYTPKHL